MADPTYKASGTPAQVINGSAGITPALPAGFAADDLAYAIVGRRSTSLTIPSDPSGWTLVAGPITGTAERLYLYRRRLQAGDTDPTFTWSGTTGDQYAWIHTVQDGAVTVTPEEVVGSGQNGTTNNPSLTGITTLTPGSLVCVAIFYGDDNNSAFALTSTDPAAFVEQYDESTTGADATLCFAHAIRATAGATGSVAVAGLTVTAGDGWTAVVWDVIPEPAGGGGGIDGTSTAALTFGGSATATLEIAGVSTKALTVGGSVTATLDMVATSSKALTVGGTTTGTVDLQATSSRTLAIGNGSTTGELLIQGTSTKALAVGGTVTASVGDSLSAESTKALTIGGSVTATLDLIATATGSLTIAGSATAVLELGAQSTKALTVSGSALAELLVQAVSTAGLTIGGSTTAQQGAISDRFIGGPTAQMPRWVAPVASGPTITGDTRRGSTIRGGTH